MSEKKRVKESKGKTSVCLNLLSKNMERKEKKCEKGEKKKKGEN